MANGFAVALVNPLRTHRFAGEELARTKTDRIDCLQIARFGAQKRPATAHLPDAAGEELRELVEADGKLHARCQFCSREYLIAPEQIAVG